MKRFALLLLLAGCSNKPETPPAISRGAAAHERWRDGHLVAAEEAYIGALEEDRFSVDVPAAIRHLNNLGVLAMYDGRLDAAEARFVEAIDLCRIEGTKDDEARLRMQLACVRMRRGDVASAKSDLASLAGWADGASDADAAQYASLQAGLSLREGDAAAAEKWARIAADRADGPEDRAGAALLLGQSLEAKPAEAAAAYREGLEAAREAGHLPLAVECLLGLARCSGDREEARRYARLAHDAARARNWEPGRLKAERMIERLSR